MAAVAVSAVAVEGRVEPLVHIVCKRFEDAQKRASNKNAVQDAFS